MRCDGISVVVFVIFFKYFEKEIDNMFCRFSSIALHLVVLVNNLVYIYMVFFFSKTNRELNFFFTFRFLAGKVYTLLKDGRHCSFAADLRE